MSQKKWRRGGFRDRARKNFFSSSFPLSLLLSSTFVFLRFLFRATVHYPLSTVHYAWNTLVHSGPESFFPMPMQGIYRCPFRSIWHFRSSYSRCNYSCSSISKTSLFFFFPFFCRGKVLAICFWWWCFIVDRNELKYFLTRSLQSTFISVIVIHRNVHLYLNIITRKRELARKKKVF